jgi:hypothetical protein
MIEYLLDGATKTGSEGNPEQLHSSEVYCVATKQTRLTENHIRALMKRGQVLTSFRLWYSNRYCCHRNCRICPPRRAFESSILFYRWVSLPFCRKREDLEAPYQGWTKLFVSKDIAPSRCANRPQLLADSSCTELVSSPH